MNDAALLYVPTGRKVGSTLTLNDVRSEALGNGEHRLLRFPRRDGLLARAFSRIATLHYMTAVANSSALELRCDVDETALELPESLGGMSGGPALSLTRGLVGINVREDRRPAGSRSIFASQHSVPSYAKKVKCFLARGLTMSAHVVSYRSSSLNEPTAIDIYIVSSATCIARAVRMRTPLTAESRL